jgi:undecaprenyl-diphosphatase
LIPTYCFCIILKLGAKQNTVFTIVCSSLGDMFTDQIKNGFQRLRPCNNSGNQFFYTYCLVRDLSFFCIMQQFNMVMTFLFFNFKDKIKFSVPLFIWLLILLTVESIWLHYPLDILSGYLSGLFLVSGFSVYKTAQERYFPQPKKE